MTRILVCGGRDYIRWDLCPRINNNIDKSTEQYKLYYPQWRKLDSVLNSYIEYTTDGYPTGELTIISGMAKGVDTAAANWAGVNWFPLLEFHPDWDLYGKAAGPIRNKRMLTEGKPDLVIAFPGGKGTANMVKQATTEGVLVKHYDFD